MDFKQKVRVLIAEDDFLVGQMIRGTVEELGCTVIAEADNGVEAVRLVETIQPDLVLMDIQMPDMNGIEAARLIYESRPTPVVVLTAYETSTLVEQASRAGVGAYLVKPPNARELERAITIALARFEDMLELQRLNTELQLRYTEKEALVSELQAALAKVKLLSGLLPICASCKKIRDDQGYWTQIEVYIRDHSEAEFSHGICPTCAKTLYPEFFSDADDDDLFKR
jgi:YesN/AraC family two-component response regulator